MLELRGNIFDLIETGKYDGYCVTTNGFVKSNGECVMGRGIALEVKKRYPLFPLRLGRIIEHFGNHVHIIDTPNETPIFSFPVKHNWWEIADVELIKRSCCELLKMLDEHNLHNVLLPRPGCGNGKLNWDNVKPIIEEILDDRVIVTTY